MSETTNWSCPNCDARKIYPYAEMMAHIREIHSLDPKRQHAQRTLLFHAKFAGGSSRKYEWTLGGLKFHQVVIHQYANAESGVRSAEVKKLAALPPAGSLTDEDWMPFGKYGPEKGDPRRMKDVPAKYLDWLAGQDFIVQWPRVLMYIEWRRPHLNQELERQERER